MHKLVFSILVLVIGLNSFAQPANCNTDKHNEFDFWVGEWNVYDTSGKLLGTNIVTKDLDNCLIEEHWESTGINKGSSYNYYNPADSTWNQLWVDNQGTILKLKGVASENKMTLRSDILLSNNNKKYYNHITWTHNDDGSVTQTWMYRNERDEDIAIAFIGIYKKQ